MALVLVESRNAVQTSNSYRIAYSTRYLTDPEEYWSPDAIIERVREGWTYRPPNVDVPNSIQFDTDSVSLNTTGEIYNVQLTRSRTHFSITWTGTNGTIDVNIPFNYTIYDRRESLFIFTYNLLEFRPTQLFFETDESFNERVCLIHI